MSCRSGQVDGREQRPIAALRDPAHEQVGHPVGRVHVVRAAAIVAGVLAQFEELLDVEVPGLEIGAHRALALAALVDGDGGVVDHLQERHDALALAVGALDVAPQRAHVGPVVAETAGELGQQRVLLQRLVDAVQVVRHRRQIAARQLRAARPGVEEGRRARHEVEGREHLVELDRARLAVDLVQRQPHRDAHEEGLRQFDAALADVQEVAIEEGLQPEVVELHVALGLERRTQARQVELQQLLVEQFGTDAELDEAREVLRIARRHLRVRHFLAEDLLADRVQQQPCRGARVARVLLDQRARGEDRGLVHLLDRHTVVQVAPRLGHDRVRPHLLAQARAGRLDERGQARHVQRHEQPAIGHHRHRRRGLRRPGLARPLLRAALAVQHVGPRHLMVAAAHQAEFDMVLHVLDVKGAATRARAHQRTHDDLRQFVHRLAHACRRGTLRAMHGEESLHQRHRDLVRLEHDHGAVATDDLVSLINGRGARGHVSHRRRGFRNGAARGGLADCLHLHP